jgi:diguanylate cyclase (GGDEF)-like protein/putative nucleotidyltransferase with HDIG domain
MLTESRRRTKTARSLYSLIAKRLDSIPSLPAILGSVRAAALSERQSTRELARLVAADPALTAKVLKVSNSTFYGCQLQISTPAHAAALLGLPALRSLANGIAEFPERAEEEGGLDREQYWVHSLAVAAASRAVARAVDFDLPEEAYVAGLLHDIGKVVFDLFSPAEHRTELLLDQDSKVPVLSLEREHLGSDHAQVGALLAEHWRLPRMVRDAIQFHHEGPERWKGLPEQERDLVGIVTISDRICCRTGYGLEIDATADEQPLAMPDGRTLDPEQIAGVLAEIETSLAAALESFGIGDGEGSIVERLRRENAKARLRPERQASRPDDLSRTALLGEVIRAARDAESVDVIISNTLDAVQKGLGFDRLLFLQLDPEEGQLRGRYIADETHVEVDPGMVAVRLNPDGLVGVALREGTAQRVDNWATDGDLLRLLGVVEVVVAPIIVKRQPLGLLCGDFFFQNLEITEMDVTLLGILGQDLGLSVENSVLSRQAYRLRSLASKDELTGINNRRNLMRLLQVEIDRARRYGSPLSAVMVDIDHFKPVNDTYGHQVGDTTLAQVAQLIVVESRDVDIIGRYGGEEFTIVLPETHIDQAIVYAERLRVAVDRFGVTTNKTYPDVDPLTISIGVTSLKRDTDDIESLIRRCDHALYAAKKRGRNRVCVD